MSKRPLNSYVGALAVAIGLAVVINPKLRAFLLLARGLGLELLLIWFATQLRSLHPLLTQLARTAETLGVANERVAANHIAPLRRRG